MSLRVLHVSCNIRPVRIAFVVSKPEPAILEEVFRVNTVLWGGLLNPVVVLDGGARKKVGRHYEYGDTPYDEEIRLLLREFDPDLLINFDGSALPASFDIFKERTFTKDALRWNPWNRGEVPFFLEVWPFLRNYWRSEVRFSKEPPHKFAYMEPDGPLKTYLTAVFGAFADNDESKKVLIEHFGAKLVTYDEEFRKAPKQELIFPIRATQFDLRIPSPKPRSSDIFFLLDPTEMHDVVDYWNLRAAGFRIFSLPVDCYKDYGERAKGFARWSMDPSVPKPFGGPTIVKARSVPDDVSIQVGQWFGSLDSELAPSVMGWVPRFGVRHDRVEPDVQIRSATAKDISQNVMMSETSGEIQFPPPCELSEGDQSQHWGIDLTAFGASEDTTFRLPWLKPSCDKVAKYSFGHSFGPAAARVSKHGIVAMARGDHDHSMVHEPKVTNVWTAYLKDCGFTYLKTSSAGLALDRIIEQLGGIHRCQIFQNSGVRELVHDLSNGSPRPTQFVQQAIYKAIPTKEDRSKKAREILDGLIAQQLLRQGFELQCEKCQRHDWYHLSEIAEQFKCKKCFQQQLVPLLSGRTWSYVSNGLFRLEGKMAGCVTTILALIFFRFCLGFDTKIVSSFDYQGPEGAGERDFAILTSETFQEDVDVIIGECKTAYDLKGKEKKDIKDLGLATGAYITFAIDAVDFSDDDKAYFRELVEVGIKPILLVRKHLEMPYIEIGEFRHRAVALHSDADALHRLTVIDTLGSDFANKHHIWI
jgi:hypothetical protein